MNNQAFSKIWVVIIIVFLIGGGFLAWRYLETSGEKTIQEGIANWKTYRDDV